VVLIAEKINLKYLDSLEHPLAKIFMEYARDGKEILLEITPKFSPCDYSKLENVTFICWPSWVRSRILIVK